MIKDVNLFNQRIDEANLMIDAYVHKVAERDFNRPFLSHARFMPLHYKGGTAGFMKASSDYAIELRARDFMDPKFIKTVRHELIHYFLHLDKKPHGHGKEFKEWSLKVDAGGTYHHRGNEFLYLRVYCSNCCSYDRFRYGNDLKSTKCNHCSALGLQIEDYFGMNQEWCEEADIAREEIKKNPSFVVVDSNGQYVLPQLDFQVVSNKRTKTVYRAFRTNELEKANDIALKIEGKVMNFYIASYRQIEYPYLFQCKKCKYNVRSETPNSDSIKKCPKCGNKEIILKGIR